MVLKEGELLSVCVSVPLSLMVLKERVFFVCHWYDLLFPVNEFGSVV